MRHERNCSCDRCRPSSSLSDTILMAVIAAAGVAFAIMSGSPTIVVAVVALLLGVLVCKIGAPMLGPDRRHREK